MTVLIQNRKNAAILLLPVLLLLQCAAGLDAVRKEQVAVAGRVNGLEARLDALEQQGAADRAETQQLNGRTRTALMEVRASLNQLAARLDSVAGISRRQVLNLDSQLALLTDEIREFEIRMSGRKPGHSGTTPAFDLRRAYTKGIRFYSAGKFREAIGAFKMADNPDVLPDLADNARYWTGESQFELGEYEDALTSFNRVLAIPQSNKCDDALFRIARIHMKEGRTAAALEAFRKLVAGYPDSEYIKEAQEGILELER